MNLTKTQLIPISLGELFDKLTTPQIKLENLKDTDALKILSSSNI